MITGWLIEKFGPLAGKLISYGIVLSFIGATLWFAYSWAYDRGVASQTAIVAQAKATTQRALDANAADASTIATLQAQNAACVASVAAKTSAADTASAVVIHESAKRQAAYAATTAKRRAIYSHDSKAAAWGRETVPEGVANELR